MEWLIKKVYVTQVIVGDLLSYDDMRQAVKGMDYMYYAFAVQDGLLEGSSIAAVVAAEAGTSLPDLYPSRTCMQLPSPMPADMRSVCA